MFGRGIIFKLAGAVLLAVGVTGCSVQNQETPELAGPSELTDAQACKAPSGSQNPDINSPFCTISLSAAPDRLPQDGASQSVVTAVVVDKDKRPLPNIILRWTVTASDGSVVEPSPQITVTDAQGRASTVVTAPPAPAQLPTSALRLRVEVEPIGPDAQKVVNEPSVTNRSVVVELVPPGGTPAANQTPVPSFTIVPSVANVNQSVTFDASATMDEGLICSSRCSYTWNYVNGTDVASDSGMVVSRTFAVPGTYSVTLTVVDDRGGSASLQKSLTVSGPAVTTVTFTNLPATPTAGASVTFTFTGAPAAGVTIQQYEWSWGDGTSNTVTVAPFTSTTHTFGSSNSTGYAVKLTITDNFGRTSTLTRAIVVN